MGPTGVCHSQDFGPWKSSRNSPLSRTPGPGFPRWAGHTRWAVDAAPGAWDQGAHSLTVGALSRALGASFSSGAATA